MTLIYLPHEIVKCDDRTGNIQRRVENVGEVICEGVPVKRVGDTRSLLVRHGFLINLSELSERIAYLRRSGATSCRVP